MSQSNEIGGSKTKETLITELIVNNDQSTRCQNFSYSSFRRVIRRKTKIRCIFKRVTLSRSRVHAENLDILKQNCHPGTQYLLGDAVSQCSQNKSHPMGTHCRRVGAAPYESCESDVLSKIYCLW